MPLRRSRCLTTALGFSGLGLTLALSLALGLGSARAASDLGSTEPSSATPPIPAEPPVVEVEAIGGDEPPVREAVLRIQAELQAVGFKVRLAQHEAARAGAPPAAPAAAQPVGRLLLVRSGNTVQILAQSAYLDAPLTQQVDLSRSSTTAEVLAIRAVEVLRAALVQSLRDKTLPRESMPEAVLTFTQWSEASREATAPAPAVEPVSRPVTNDPATDSMPTSAPREDSVRAAWLFAAGPVLQRPSHDATLTAGVEAHLSRNFGPAFVGVLIDGSLAPSHWRTEAGVVDARGAAFLGRGGLNLSCPKNITCQVGAGVGARHWSFVATKADGSAASEKAYHTSLAVEAEALFGYLVDGQTGVLVHGRVGALANAPTLAADVEEAESWGRPSFDLALCGAVRF